LIEIYLLDESDEEEGMSIEGDRFKVLDERLIDIQGRLVKLRRTQLADHETLQTVLEAIKKLTTKQVEVRFMFVVKDDHADVNFSLVLGDVTDAEGNTIPDAQLDLAVTSSDDTVVAVTFDASARSGSVSFGHPGVASVTATVSSGGSLLGSGAADFTVTVGDPAAISSVALNFDGITES